MGGKGARPSGAGAPGFAGRADAKARFTARQLTSSLRVLPDFVIVGTMRGGTTSLINWLNAQPGVAPAYRYAKEVHYFDRDYGRGPAWYRSHFPVRWHRGITGESSTHMLYNPVSPVRAARDLPAHTTFLVVLRDPVQRAISHYWHNRRIGLWETEPIARALDLEPERLAATQDAFERGEWSREHMAFSYQARGDYAPQLRRWFDAVGRDRVLVLESERLYDGGGERDLVLDRLGLEPAGVPYPQLYGADRLDGEDAGLLDRLRTRFAAPNRELFELLGRELWTGDPGRSATG